MPPARRTAEPCPEAWSSCATRCRKSCPASPRPSGSSGERAKEDCVLLAHALPRDLAATVITSAQPKAAQTAAVIAIRRGLQVRLDDRVREVEQPTGWLDGDYRALAAAYLGGDTSLGWESHAHVQARFAAAIEESAPEGGDLVVVNHGLALSLYLASLAPRIVTRAGDQPFEIVPFWRALAFPDAWRLDFGTNRLTRLLDAGLPAE